MTTQLLQSKIRHVPDFPKPGILFYDITTLLRDAEGLRLSLDAMGQPYHDAGVDLVVGMESRGFIFGAALADRLQAGFVPVRKPGKLPAKSVGVSYALEYGTDTLEVHADAITPGQRVLIVDDLLATGGTAAATIQLVSGLGGDIVGCAFLVELTFLDGRARLGTVPVHAVMQYDA
ncbi:MAG: adenine phosphoribosyltransferase [Acidobacteria bacterium]|nr:adenine phosphoribosyltransferase [Acidobacteriota bacterium]